MEGDVHWKYLDCCRVHVEARVQGGRDQPAGCPGPEYQGWSEFQRKSTSYTCNLQVLSKTLDMTKQTPEKIELATLTRKKGKTQIKILPAG